MKAPDCDVLARAEPPLPVPQGEMRIVSYNIRKAVGLDWRRDPDRIADVLEEISADVVVLQEADKRLGARAGVLSPARLESLGYRIAPLALRPASHGWHGNAILVRVGQELAAAERISLPMLEPRGAVLVRLTNPGLVGIGVHLGLTAAMRRRQLSDLKTLVSGLSDPVILAGDFNARGPALAPLADICTVLLPGPTFHATLPRIPFDRFATCCKVKVVRTFVHHSPRSARASDHLPIVMDFTLPWH